MILLDVQTFMVAAVGIKLASRQDLEHPHLCLANCPDGKKAKTWNYTTWKSQPHKAPFNATCVIDPIDQLFNCNG